MLKAVDFIFAPIVPEILRAKVSVFVDRTSSRRRCSNRCTNVTLLSEQFRDGEAYTRSVRDNVADGIVTVSSDGIVESFNRAASDLFGYREAEVVGQSFTSMISRKGVDRHERSGHALLRHLHVGRSQEWVGFRKDGTHFSMELDLSDVQLGEQVSYIACLRDNSEREQYTEALQHQALHDPLTGLPNRVLFGDRVNYAIRAIRRTRDPLALLVMDLDGFKLVNDSLGHHVGDALLELVAGRLQACLRDGDTVARLGGDEFGILLLGGGSVPGVASVVWKIQAALEPTFEIAGHAIDVRASIGIVQVPEHGDNINDLLRRADLAMYDAKRLGSGYALFASEQEDAPARRLSLLGDLRHCIERNELVLHYQPKIDLATGRTMGVEALIRWNRPSGNLLMPDQFMTEVECHELMVPITAWVIGEALRTLRSWRDLGYDLTMAVNLGAHCLAPGAHLFETADELTTRWGIPPDRLTFELTESALIDTAGPGLMTRLEEMDERLSIDDFGTGYSSLVYLQRLPVVELKIDRSFVTSLLTAPSDAVIVRSIIDLAHNLSVQVVAEGVEDEQTMDALAPTAATQRRGTTSAGRCRRWRCSSGSSAPLTGSIASPARRSRCTPARSSAPPLWRRRRSSSARPGERRTAAGASARSSTLARYVCRDARRTSRARVRIAPRGPAWARGKCRRTGRFDMSGLQRLWRTPRRALMLGLVLAITVGAVTYAATSPAISTFTPRSEHQITNVDVLRQQIRNYYGDPLGTGVFAPDSNYAREATFVATRGSWTLARAAYSHHRPAHPAIVLDVDDTTLVTWNYEIFSNWAYNPTTNATYVTGELFPPVPGMLDTVTKAAAEGYAVFYLTGRPAAQESATLGNLTADNIGFDAGYPAPTALLNGEDGLFTKPPVADYPDYLKAACAGDPNGSCTTVHYKSATRAHIESLGYEIVGNFGDQYSDLQGGYADHVFKLPNPNYFLP